MSTQLIFQFAVFGAFQFAVFEQLTKKHATVKGRIYKIKVQPYCVQLKKPGNMAGDHYFEKTDGKSHFVKQNHNYH